MSSRPRLLALLLAVVVTLTACGSDDRDAGSGPDTAPGTSSTDRPPTSEGGGGWLDGEPPRDSAGGGSGGESDALSDGGAERAGATAASGAAPVTADASSDLAAPPPGENGGGSLRAGSVDDNVNFADYLAYREDFAATGIPVHDVDVSERHIVQVVTPSGLPVLGAAVEVAVGNDTVLTHTTIADGTTMFFPRAIDELAAAEEITVTASRDGERATTTVERGPGTHVLVLDVDPAGEGVALDILFLIDTTGSMSDEIARLKETVDDVAAQIAASPSQPDVRFGMTIYRDHGDAYLTRTFDFTGDVEDFREALALVQADGGGDTPEALDEALHEALARPAWRGGETVSLLFLIADAPPHVEPDPDQQTVTRDSQQPGDAEYSVDMLEAAARGIEIVPLASSGLDDQGEYVFRQLAQVTGGPFLFLTYGPDGGPGDDTDHHVSGYDVLSLDELIVKVVEDELAALRGESPQAAGQ